MFGGRKVRSNKGKKRGPYRARSKGRVIIAISKNGNRSVRTRKVRSNKGKKRRAYGPRSGKKNRQAGGDNNNELNLNQLLKTSSCSGNPSEKYKEHKCEDLGKDMCANAGCTWTETTKTTTTKSDTETMSAGP